MTSRSTEAGDGAGDAGAGDLVVVAAAEADHLMKRRRLWASQAPHQQ